MSQAAKENVNFLVMGETWLSGYPAWLDHCPDIGRWNHEPMKEVFVKLHESSIAIPGNDLDLICKWAKQYKIVLCIGVNEKVYQGPGNGTIYNTLLLIDDDGKLLNHHRKLVPTFTENYFMDMAMVQGFMLQIQNLEG